MSALLATAQALMIPGKGLLAMDESVGTCNRRLAEAGIAQTEESRRRYRDMLVTSPGLSASISGAILFEETLLQRSDDGKLFTEVLRNAGILIGIKVDTGVQPLAGQPGEWVTEGLDGLRARLQRFEALGARFAKWRAVLSISAERPSRAAISANAQALARYAALCQEAQLVPIVEPEVLMEGAHTLAQCIGVTTELLHQVFEQLYVHGVVLEGMILKPHMVLPGLDHEFTGSDDELADASLDCLLQTVPAATAGIAFLSGGQDALLATARLNRLHQRARARHLQLPWPLRFSFGRALQQPALALWGGKAANRHRAQQALLHRASCNAAALAGHWLPRMEAEGSTA